MNIINEEVEIKKKLSKHNNRDLRSNTSKTFNSEVFFLLIQIAIKDVRDKIPNQSNFNIFKRNTKNHSQDARKPSEK